jgi:glutamate synthase (NADPH/NADH) small chain
VQAGKKVTVVGGGNVAMDAARCAKRLGAEVMVLYRRTEAEMPARREEMLYAGEEGIEFSFLTNPTEIGGNDEGWVNRIYCDKMKTRRTGRIRPGKARSRWWQ